MKINKLELYNYRNFSKLSLEGFNSVNIFYGKNGQGKTNLVEAIYVLAKSNSFRTSHHKELIALDKEEARLSISFIKKDQVNENQMILNKIGKTCFVNKKRVTKISEYLSSLNSISFTPEDVSIFKDSPSSRRHLLDSELCSLDLKYVKELIEYRHILDKRNILLKQKKVDILLLSVLDEQLINKSYRLYKGRKWLIKEVNALLPRIVNYLSGEDKTLEIVYKSFVGLEIDSLDDYKEMGKKALQEAMEKDLKYMYTNVGVHKDDFVVMYDNKEVNMYASQGQQRMLALSIKLAIIEIIKQNKKEEPIIILDDAFSELDDYKKEKLVSYVLKKQQVFITCTDYKEIITKKNKYVSLYKVDSGNISKLEE